MRGIAILLCSLVASCFGPRIEEGVIDCSGNGLCPPRFLCADDGFCRKSEVAHDAAATDAGGGPDACGSACDLDFQCVATLGEARLDSYRATREGGLVAVDSLELPADGDPSDVGADSEIVHCGPAIYVAGDGGLLSVPVAADATLGASSPLGSPATALACTGGFRLWAAQISDAEVTLRSWDATGGSLNGEQSVSLGNNPGGQIVTQLRLMPDSSNDGRIVVVVTFRGLLIGTTFRAFIVTRSGESLSITDGPSDIGLDVAGETMSINPAGTALIQSGFDTMCTALWVLGDELPTMSDREIVCTGDFANSVDHAFLNDGFFVQTGTGLTGHLRVHQYAGGLSNATTQTDGGLRDAQLVSLYDAEVVVAATGQSMEIKSLVSNGDVLQVVETLTRASDVVDEAVTFSCAD